MSTPRIKRPFAGSSADPAQRQITCFFPCSTTTAPTSEIQPSHPRQPLLPSSVQANLLSVGMRVRKSVPEGYKTSGPSAFKMWTDTTRPPPRAAAAPQRELLPFCGINKVGGLESQPAFRQDGGSDEDEDDQVPDLDSVPELTLSQESADNSEPSSSSSSRRKRSFTENDADDQPTMLSLPPKVWDDQVSPRSFAPSPWSSSRAIAVPKRRARRSTSPPEAHRDIEDGEQDFAEADFLVLAQSPEMDLS